MLVKTTCVLFLEYTALLCLSLFTKLYRSNDSRIHAVKNIWFQASHFPKGFFHVHKAHAMVFSYYHPDETLKTGNLHFLINITNSGG